MIRPVGTRQAISSARIQAHAFHGRGEERVSSNMGRTSQGERIGWKGCERGLPEGHNGTLWQEKKKSARGKSCPAEERKKDRCGGRALATPWHLLVADDAPIRVFFVAVQRQCMRASIRSVGRIARSTILTACMESAQAGGRILCATLAQHLPWILSYFTVFCRISKTRKLRKPNILRYLSFLVSTFASLRSSVRSRSAPPLKLNHISCLYCPYGRRFLLRKWDAQCWRNVSEILMRRGLRIALFLQEQGITTL